MKRFYRIIWTVIALAGIYFLVRTAEVFLGLQAENSVGALKKNICYFVQDMIVEDIFPALTFPAKGEKMAGNFSEYLVKQAYRAIPIYGYTEEYLLFKTGQEDLSTYEKILAQEANDENQVDSVTGEILSKEESAERSPLEAPLEEDSEEDAKSAETEETAETSVRPAEGGISYSIEQLVDFDFLLNTFYTVDTSTAISEEVLNVEKLLQKDMQIDITQGGPQILIYHTHSQESFLDSVPGDLSTGIVGAGNYLAQLLQETYGYEVLHVTDVFDMVDGKEDRNNAYTLAGARISQLLKEHPSIQVVIDLHRDGVKEGTRLVTNVNGKETAQLMFFNGLSYSKKNGAISYLPNPYIEENLALALQLQLKAAEYYPGVTRKIYLKTYRYNMHLCPKTILVECGAQTNTLEEAKNAMEPLASVLHMVLGK